MDYIDEPVELAPYQPEWATHFERAAARLRSALALGIDAIEHIGSTAVPGLAAKPIIDILLGTDCYPPPEAQSRVIEALGYECLGEAGVPGRIYYRKRGGISYNLHVTMRAGEIWNANVTLRDYLRSHPEQARRYGAYKCEAIAKHPHSLLAYSRLKEPMILELLVKARSWREGPR